MNDLPSSLVGNPRMAEIAEACFKDGATPKFLEQLARCVFVSETDIDVVLASLNPVDDEWIAHAVGATLDKNVRVNTWKHTKYRSALTGGFCCKKVEATDG